MKMFRLVTSFATGLFYMAAPALAASIPQDTPTAIDGVELVCTGVGSAQDDPRWPSYPVRVVFSNEGGQFVAGEHVLLNQGSKQIAAFDCDAPWVLFKLPPGDYSVTATLPGAPGPQPHTVRFTTSGSEPQKAVEVMFPRLPPNQ